MLIPPNGEPPCLAHHHLVDRAALRAQRHANADLASSLAYGVRNDAVKPDHSQHQRNHREAADEPCGEAMENRRLRGVNLVIHGDLAVCAEVWIDLVQGFDEQQAGWLFHHLRFVRRWH